MWRDKEIGNSFVHETCSVLTSVIGTRFIATAVRIGRGRDDLETPGLEHVVDRGRRTGHTDGSIIALRLIAVDGDHGSGRRGIGLRGALHIEDVLGDRVSGHDDGVGILHFVGAETETKPTVRRSLHHNLHILPIDMQRHFGPVIHARMG